jgi:hypothetical protein
MKATRFQFPSASVGSVHRSGVGGAEGALLTLGLLEGDEEGCAETLGDPDADVEGPVDGSIEGPEEGALLTLGIELG